MTQRQRFIEAGIIKPSPVVYGPQEILPLSPEAVLELRRKLIKRAILIPGLGRRTHGIGH